MSLRTFKEHYLREAAAKTVTVNFGRFNPPTIGHEKLLDISMSKGTGDHRVYATQTSGNKKNPLDWKTKIKYMRKVFPKHARHILIDKKVKTIWDVAVTCYKDGYTEFEMFVGDDRHQEFVKLLDDWNGRKGKHGFYEFDVIDIQSAGIRDPDVEGAEGMSASKMRAAAEDNDLIAFTSGLPKKFKDAKGLMKAVQNGMGIKESKDFRQDIKLKRVSLLRDKYVAGNLFNVNDDVVTLNGEEGIINKLGSNHVEVRLKESERFKNFWLSDVCLNN
jgi:hypothetical protein